MKRADVKALPVGVYRVNWRQGGSSIAAVGVGPSGDKWLAPLNWVEPVDSDSAARVWIRVESVELMLSTQCIHPGTPHAFYDVRAIHELVTYGPRPRAFMGGARAS